MNRNWLSIKNDVSGKQILLLLILLCVLAAIRLGIVRTWQNFDQWHTFNSNGKYYTSEYPNFQIEYPPTWNDKVYQGYFRSTDDVWVDIGDFSASLLLYWRQEENLTINELSMWGQEIIEIYRGYNVSQLQETRVGVEDYLAFQQTFQGSTNHTYNIVYILNEESGYLLLFHARSYNAETEKLFHRILDSFQIFETQ